MHIHRTLSFLIIWSLCLLFIVNTADAADEKTALKNSYFGNFNNAKVIKKSGKITLKRWAPYVQHVKSLPWPVEPEGIDAITVEYDEIWVKENDEGFPDHMRKRLKGQFDIHKLYWNKSKIQASTLERYFLGNPATGSSLNPPVHKLIILYGREGILSRLK